MFGKKLFQQSYLDHRHEHPHDLDFHNLSVKPFILYRHTSWLCEELTVLFLKPEKIFTEIHDWKYNLPKPYPVEYLEKDLQQTAPPAPQYL